MNGGAAGAARIRTTPTWLLRSLKFGLQPVGYETLASHIGTKLVFISAAEPSADRHGAGLIRAVRRLDPDVRFVGVAGPLMREAGCDGIFDMTGHATMLLGVLGAIPRAIRMLTTAERHLRMYPFRATVVIDAPMLHLPLSARSKSAGVPVLYYIAPQMWAWGAHRIHKLRNNVEHVAAILPFEEEFFRGHGVDATFVGHPLADSTGPDTYDEARVQEIRRKGKPVIALLPGSRKHVVSENLPGQLEVARAIVERFPESHIGVSAANPQVADVMVPMLEGSSLKVRAYAEHRTELVRAADLVLVTSGTSTLEVAFHERPMIVMYNASRLFYHLIARWMIRTPHFALPNILAQREIVPEFMPYYRSTEPIARRAIELLESESARTAMIEDLRQIVAPLRGRSASEETAKHVLAMIDH